MSRSHGGLGRYLLNRIKVGLRFREPGAPVFEVYRGGVGPGGGDWYWRERVNGRPVAGGMEDFVSKSNAKRAAYARAASTTRGTVEVLDIYD